MISLMIAYTQLLVLKFIRGVHFWERRIGGECYWDRIIGGVGTYFNI